MELKFNLKSVNSRIIQAAKRTNRNPQQIHLVVAGKYADIPTTQSAIKAGVKIIGENREQDLRNKFKAIGGKVDWHFIGHLQTNKVKSVINIVSLIHSVDSFKLAQKINQQLSLINQQLPILIEVNTSGEYSKQGINPSKTLSFVKKISQFKHLKLQGLMTMGALVKKPEDNRKNFKLLNNLQQKISTKFNLKNFNQLSMGTTQDFEVAIEEGATLVRVGSAIFK